MASFYKAYDLPAVQRTCRYYNDPQLLHKVCVYTAERVYLTRVSSSKTASSDSGSNSKTCPKEEGKEKYLTIGHLRNIELEVVARILSSPEPKTGYYVSKSWIKNSLLWLEKVNETPSSSAHHVTNPNVGKKAKKKKLNKKQLRQRDRRLSDVSPPWPDACADILCSHQKLQRCNAKTARARRRLMDKKAWKILKKLYPDSTQLDSHAGECLQCLMETETQKRSEQDKKEQAKLERKQPLSNPLVRAFYTRTRGVPSDRLRVVTDDSPGTIGSRSSAVDYKPVSSCPLQNGTYMILPRAWCHKWRRYIKTGEGGVPLPPGSSEVLCHAHQLALIPPHLEFYIQGQTSHLYSSIKDFESPPPVAAPASSASGVPVGAQPPTVAAADPDTIEALVAAGIPHSEILSQRMAMMNLQQLQQHQDTVLGSSSATHRDSATQNDLLNRENHVVVELVSREEFVALQETGCWPKHVSNFCVSVTIDGPWGQSVTYSTDLCQKCDPTGSRYQTNACIKYRRKRWEPKNVENRRMPNLEY